MKVAARRIDIQYEAQFRRPAFTLAGKIGDLLASLYAALAQSAGVRTEDLFAVPSQRMSEIACRVILQAINGSIEVSADKVSATFRQLSNPEEISLVKQIVGAVEDTTTRVLEESLATWNIGVHAWLHSQDGRAGVVKLLRKNSGSRIDPAPIGATVHETSLKGFLSNVEEKWGAVYIFEPSALPEGDLYMGIQVNGVDPTSDTIEARAFLIQRIREGLFAQLGLETEGASGGSPVVH
jgi:hypothetical protein